MVMQISRSDKHLSLKSILSEHVIILVRYEPVTGGCDLCSFRTYKTRYDSNGSDLSMSDNYTF